MATPPSKGVEREPVLGSASSLDNPAPRAGPSNSAHPSQPGQANAISYNRDHSTVNQIPVEGLHVDAHSTPLDATPSPAVPAVPAVPATGTNTVPTAPADNDMLGANDVPDVPPPSYEEAVGMGPPRLPPRNTGQHQQAPRLPPRPTSSSSNPHIPGAYPRTSTRPGNARPPSSSSAAAGGNGGSGANGLLQAGNRHSSGAASVSSASPGSVSPGLPKYSRRPGSESGPAPGSIPPARQFPQRTNMYGDKHARQFMLAEHQHVPLYAVRMRPVWGRTGSVIWLHNGPNADTCPLLAQVDEVRMSDALLVTLPPPLTYTGSGSTAVRLEVEHGWSHYYTFTMEVGTALSNVHAEMFEWRHSSGSAVASLGGAREGWKLVRMSKQALPGVPPAVSRSSFFASDGNEVVAMFSDARMSMTKHLHFAYVGTGQSGALGERWAVMAITSALGIWEKEDAVQHRR